MNHPRSALWLLLVSLASSLFVVGQGRCQIGGTNPEPHGPAYRSTYDAAGRCNARDHGDFDYSDLGYSDFDYNYYGYREYYGYPDQQQTSAQAAAEIGPRIPESVPVEAERQGYYADEYGFERYEYGGVSDRGGSAESGVGNTGSSTAGEYGYGSYEFGDDETRRKDASNEALQAVERAGQPELRQETDPAEVDADSPAAVPSDPRFDPGSSDADPAEAAAGHIAEALIDEYETRLDDADHWVSHEVSPADGLDQSGWERIRPFLCGHDPVYDRAVYGVGSSIEDGVILVEQMDDPSDVAAEVEFDFDEFSAPVDPAADRPAADRPTDSFDDLFLPIDADDGTGTDPGSGTGTSLICPEQNTSYQTTQLECELSSDSLAYDLWHPASFGCTSAWDGGCEMWYQGVPVRVADQDVAPVASIISSTAPIWQSLGLLNLATMALQATSIDQLELDAAAFSAVELQSIVDPDCWVTGDCYVGSLDEPVLHGIEGCDAGYHAAHGQSMLLEAAETLEGFSTLLTEAAGKLRELAQSPRLTRRIGERTERKR